MPSLKHLHRLPMGLLVVAAGWIPITTFAQPDVGSSGEDAAVVGAVLAANADMVAAANRMDLDAFFGAMIEADRTMIVQNGAIFQTRAEARVSVERGLRGIARVDRRFDNPQVTVISPETALLVSEGSVTATLNDGREMIGRFAVSLIFVLRDGQWKLLHGHYSTPMAQD